MIHTRIMGRVVEEPQRQRTGPKVDAMRHTLARWREEQGLSIRALSRISGVPQATISRTEMGSSPSGHTTIRLVKAIRSRDKRADPLEVIFGK
jgi:predicted transcriptional regulator